MDNFPIIMNPLQSRCEREVEVLLRSAGIRFSQLSDIPLSTIRHTQRGAFPDMRMIYLAPDLRDAFLAKPISRDLLCTRVGFQGPSPAHYIPRPTGSYDCILIYCTAGRGWLEVDGKVHTVEKRDAFLLPSHTPHIYGADPDNPWSNYWVHFQGSQSIEYAELVSSSPSSPVVHLSQHREVAGCIEELYRLMSHLHTYQAIVAASGALSQLLGVIQLRMHVSGQRARSVDENIDKSIEFMHRNLGRKLTLKELANIAGMSHNHYGALFKRRYGITPIDCFTRLKIQRACELLSTTDMRVNEVGTALGVPDPYYFSRLFKKIMGVSPRHY